MAANSQWTYRIGTGPAGDHTMIHIQTVPQSVVQRRTASVQSTRQCPPTPRIPYLALPGQPGCFRFQMPDLFPIDLSQNGLSSVHMALLSDFIPPFTTISIRDTSNYVLCNVKTGSSAMTTADLVQFLQHVVCAPLPSDSYRNMSPSARESAKVNFISRNGAQGHDRWGRFVSGSPRFGVPTGLDLLVGKIRLWMLDPDNLGGWVATVDAPQPRYPGLRL
ncbi:hypothetical protein MSAN_02267200 [Mycena sanguinolenta]|uniref:Uncharacterized protein n=1 Tax=Mycena sanguinolenta TaxID=230812 RepID=A0A8H7CJ85_9AGAR|nr:hypothetical protein MSAN_02267200 [Mycena sanguinolenta]